MRRLATALTIAVLLATPIACGDSGDERTVDQKSTSSVSTGQGGLTDGSDPTETTGDPGSTEETSDPAEESAEQVWAQYPARVTGAWEVDPNSGAETERPDQLDDVGFVLRCDGDGCQVDAEYMNFGTAVPVTQTGVADTFQWDDPYSSCGGTVTLEADLNVDSWTGMAGIEVPAAVSGSYQLTYEYPAPCVGYRKVIEVDGDAERVYLG